MINIAVLGFGIVGSGVVEIIRKSGESISKKAGDTINLKYILDIRDFPDSPERNIITKNPDDIFNDPEVNIIVETIGGIGVAYELTKRALVSGRSVVTSNKELVATHGPELMKLAKERKIYYMFEASVGGGIPIIKPLYECLSANEITSIAGILNGTTNYILTSMANEGRDFESALKEAQAKGYAEANPTADIEGHDSCRKIAILSSIAYGKYVDYRNIPTEGISKITIEDLKIAEKINLKVKLLGFSRKQNGKVFAKVCPVMLDKANALANVEDVFNAILISGDSIGDVMFYGRGAGKLPTASAVVNDIIDVVKTLGRDEMHVWEYSPDSSIIDTELSETSYLIRVKVRNAQEARRYIQVNFGQVDMYEFPEYPEQLVFKTGKGSESSVLKKIEILKEAVSIRSVISAINIFE